MSLFQCVHQTLNMSFKDHEMTRKRVAIRGQDESHPRESVTRPVGIVVVADNLFINFAARILLLCE